MEKARKKLRFCLLLVVLAAVLAGVWYYQVVSEEGKVSEGTLVMHSVTRKGYGIPSGKKETERNWV